MPRTNKTGSPRDRELRRILEEQRDRILGAIRLTIREGREEGAIENDEVQDEAEQSEADAQSELEFSLLQMQGETLSRVEEALDRLDEGRYGLCMECGRAIPTRRLEALPFATRCLDCEQESETTDHDHRPVPSWRQSIELLSMGD